MLHISQNCLLHVAQNPIPPSHGNRCHSTPTTFLPHSKQHSTHLADKGLLQAGNAP
jgi:hypothetical protein